ncbi:MAG: tRNA (adenosine(37)-N6)-threonylcarbamoyltransferase complex dimerization subunit type 1 TsaB [Acidobacteriaceae bacterium]|jgi:tRNA threonylcarbamoyladenosine biosynthesis protein TsaB
MKILLIDTCGAVGSVALADTEPAAVLASEEMAGRTASERLVGVVRELAERSGVGLQELGAVVAVSGPGSFTGVRVGLSAAKGLCDALGVPVVTASRLAVLAERGSRGGGRVVALLDAGRGEYYFGEYVGGVCVREALLTRDEVLEAMGREEGAVVMVCEAAVAEAMAAVGPRVVDEPRAGDALGLALQRIERGDFDDAATVDANYLRRTDAEIFAKAGASGGAIGARGGEQRGMLGR